MGCTLCGTAGLILPFRSQGSPVVSSVLLPAQGQGKTGALDRWLAVLGIGSVPSPRLRRGTSCETETVVLGQES